MLADEYESNALPAQFVSGGQLDKSSLPCLSREAVLDAIENGLVEFSGRSESRGIQNEKGITNRLCKILNCHKLLYFHHEGMQDEASGTSSVVDMEALTTSSTMFEARLYSKEQTLMAIEAKRLPSPPPKSREREYVIGAERNSGGVERFKLGIHGAEASAWALVGYVQNGSFSYWRETINGWINELISESSCAPEWHPSDKLALLAESSKTARYKSSCKRTSRGKNDVIELMHLWIALEPSHA
jgi:hypothetical protein